MEILQEINKLLSQKSKFLKSKWLPLDDAENFMHNKNIYYEFFLESVVIKLYPDEYLMYDHFDIVMNKDGKILTPDFIKLDTNNPIEFKTYWYKLKPQTIMKINEEMKMKYGQDTIVHVYDELHSGIEKYGKLIPLDRQFLLNLMIQELQNFNYEILTFENELKDYMSHHEILHLTVEALGIKDKIPKHAFEKNVDPEEKVMEICTEILEELTSNNKFELFMNNNFLNTEKLGDMISENFPKPELINVSVSHPFGRDQNRAEFKTGKGHKATNLTFFPLGLHGLELNGGLRAKLMLFYSNPMASHLINYILAPEEVRDIYDKAKTHGKWLAYLSTESDNDLSEIAHQYETNEKTVSGIINEIKFKIAHDSAIIQKYFPAVKIGKHGTFLSKLSTEEQVYVHANKGAKDSYEEDPGKVKENTFLQPGDYTEIIKQIFENVEDQEQEKYILPTDLYAQPELSRLSNDVGGTNVEALFNQILGNKYILAIKKYLLCLRSFAIHGNNRTSKGSKYTEVTCFKDPHTGFYFAITPASNEITSGAICCIGRTRIDPQKTCTHDLQSIRLDDGSYLFVTKPFRINWKIVEASEEHIGSMLGGTATLVSLGMDCLNNYLYLSLFLNNTRSLTWALEVVYLCYKNAYMIGNFGRTEMLKKLTGMDIRDVRVMTILFRLWKEYKEFANLVEFRFSTGSDLNGLFDPVFNFSLSSISTLAELTYLKQLPTKDDGYDVVKIMSGFYEDEKEYQNTYLHSDFHPLKLDPYKDMDVKDFLDKVFLNEHSWSKLSYLPQLVYHGTRLLVKNWKQTNKHSNFRPKYWYEPSVGTGKSSKVLVPQYDINLYHSKEDETKNDYTPKYKGIVSMNLTEALALEHRVIDVLLKDPNINELNKIFKISDLKSDSDQQLSLLELSCLESLIYPEASVVTMKDKVQTGYGKRAFFIQNLHMRNLNRLWDSVYRPLLEKDEFDIILKAGNEKNLKIQNDMNYLGVRLGNMMVTKDMTKFGDLYMMETKRLQLLALFDENYLTEDEFLLMWHAANCQQNRFVLMPFEVRDKINRLKTLSNKKSITLKVVLRNIIEKFTLDEAERALLKKKLNYMFNLHDNVFSSKIDELDLINNEGFIKEVGGVLGVFNILWSAFSSCIMHCIKKCHEKLFKTSLFKGSTHSDDSGDITLFPTPKADVFQELVFHKINTNTTYKILQDKVLYIKQGEWKETDFKPEIFSKLHLCLGLIIPRCFSQRPSLAKWGFGDAFEILQQIHTSDKEIHIPVIRYLATIGKDLDGRAYSIDLQSCSGRIYDALIHGAPNELLTTAILFINYFCRLKYGLEKPDYYDYFKPIEMGGFWWALPGTVLELGFAANNLRLLSISNSNHDLSSYVSKFLKLSLNTAGVWRQKAGTRILDPRSDVDVSESKDGGALEYNKTFLIKYSKKTRTTKAYVKLLKIFKDKLNLDPSLKLEDSFRKNLNKLPLSYSLSGTTFSMKLYSMLSKYTSTAFQSTYIKTSLDTKIISRIGYLERIMKHPLNPKFVHDNGGILSSRYTIKEVWDFLHSLCLKEKIVIPEDATQGYNLHLLVRSEEILFLDRLTVLNNIQVLKKTRENYRTYYVNIKPLKETVSINFSILVVSQIIEVFIDGTPFNLTQTLSWFPQYKNSFAFMTLYNTVVDFLKSLNLIEPNLRIRGRLIAQLLADPGRHFCIKLPFLEQSLNHFLSVTYTNAMWLYTITGKQSIRKDIGKPKEFILRPTVRPIILFLWISTVMKFDLDTAKILTNISEITPRNLGSILNEYKHVLPDKRRTSNIFAELLFSRAFGILVFEVDVLYNISDLNEDTIIIKIRIDDLVWKLICFEETQTFMLYINKIPENLNYNQLFNRMVPLIFNIVLPSHCQFQGLSSVKKVSKSQFAYFKSTGEISHKESHPANWVQLGIYLFDSNLDDMYGSLVDWNISGFWIRSPPHPNRSTIHSDLFKTPWFLSPTPTDVVIQFQGAYGVIEFVDREAWVSIDSSLLFIRSTQEHSSSQFYLNYIKIDYSYLKLVVPAIINGFRSDKSQLSNLYQSPESTAGIQLLDKIERLLGLPLYDLLFDKIVADKSGLLQYQSQKYVEVFDRSVRLAKATFYQQLMIFATGIELDVIEMSGNPISDNKFYKIIAVVIKIHYWYLLKSNKITEVRYNFLDYFQAECLGNNQFNLLKLLDVFTGIYKTGKFDINSNDISFMYYLANILQQQTIEFESMSIHNIYDVIVADLEDKETPWTKKLSLIALILSFDEGNRAAKIQDSNIPTATIISFLHIIDESSAASVLNNLVKLYPASNSLISGSHVCVLKHYMSKGKELIDFMGIKF